MTNADDLRTFLPVRRVNESEAVIPEREEGLYQSIVAGRHGEMESVASCDVVSKDIGTVNEKYLRNLLIQQR